MVRESHNPKKFRPMTSDTLDSPDPHQPPAGTPRWEWQVRHIVLSWFGCGLWPKAPGTIASIGAMPLGGFIHWGFGTGTLVVCAFALFFIGWAVAAAHFRNTAEIKDPQWVVVDEVVGQWLALSVVPFSFGGFALAFVLFRAFDILKPWPVSWADSQVGGALGIMLDDVLAGLYAAVVGSLLLKGFHAFLVPPI
jgi:phosphatidylglycerophosphatase A